MAIEVVIDFITPLADPTSFMVTFPTVIESEITVSIDGPLTPYPVVWELSSGYTAGMTNTKIGFNITVGSTLLGEGNE